MTAVSERAYDAVLCDLDGVLRRWDADAVEAVEIKHGVPTGTLNSVAFADEMLRPALIGEVNDDEWRRNVAVELLPTYGVEVASDLVADWSESVGEVDTEVRALLRAARGVGVRVVLVTNSTTRVGSELAVLGIDADVDLVVSSAHLGVAKPEPSFYFAAAQLAEVDVERCLFVDDTAVNVEVAEAVGMQGYVFEGPAGLREVLHLPDR